MEKISTRILEGLEMRGMKQADLVEKTHIGKSSISTYISGTYEPKQKNIYKIAKALNVSEAWLMGYDVPSQTVDSLKIIIENRINELGINLNDVALKAKVSLYWLQNINTFIPGEMEYMISDQELKELDWDDVIGGYTSYEWITRVAEAINLPGNMLRAALARQEVPLCDDNFTITPEEAFNNLPSETKKSFTAGPSKEEKKHIEKYLSLDPHGKALIDTILDIEHTRCTTKHENIQEEITQYNVIPFSLSEYKASAGRGTYLGPEAFTTIMVEKNELTKKALFGVPVSGDSMTPTYNDGDILIVERADELAVGEIGIFTLNGEGYVKKCGDGELISLNEEYKPIPMNETILLNGKVIGILKKEWIVE